MSRTGTRVVAGSLGGRVLRGLPEVRPTTSKVRAALFDSLGPAIVGARTLDLFAGTGALGIEALSRGAQAVVSVDRSGAVLKRLHSVKEEWGLDGLSILKADLPGEIARVPSSPPFDFVFADPPYAFAEHADLLRGVCELLAPDGLLLLEHGSAHDVGDPPTGLTRSKTRRYGDTSVSWFERSAAD